LSTFDDFAAKINEKNQKSYRKNFLIPSHQDPGSNSSSIGSRMLASSPIPGFRLKRPKEEIKNSNEVECDQLRFSSL
jgi:hypothetical protein